MALQFREFDRLLIPKVEDDGARVEQIRRYVLNLELNHHWYLHSTDEMGKHI